MNFLVLLSIALIFVFGAIFFVVFVFTWFPKEQKNLIENKPITIALSALLVYCFWVASIFYIVMYGL